MKPETQAIGILDSGVGGLTVVREVMRQLPSEPIVYFGDTAHCPYGPRPAEEIRRFTADIVNFLTSTFSLKALVIACNTATAVAFEKVRRSVNIPVVGVIDPGARAAIKVSKYGRIGVIGTEGTIQSGAYERALHRINPEVRIVSLACPSFVPIVESGKAEADETLPLVRQALLPLQKHSLDALILGCTHYPLLTKHIARTMGHKVELLNSAKETARELSSILSENDILTSPVHERLEPPHHTFFTSGSPEMFRQIAARWLGMLVNVKSVHLQKVSF